MNTPMIYYFHVKEGTKSYHNFTHCNRLGFSLWWNKPYYRFSQENTMSLLVDNHPLARDLPQDKDTIHQLKTSDAHFARLMGEYEVLDKQIVRIEQSVESADGLELDELKMKRVQAKDYLVKMLRAAV